MRKSIIEEASSLVEGYRKGEKVDHKTKLKAGDLLIEEISGTAPILISVVYVDLNGTVTADLIKNGHKTRLGGLRFPGYDFGEYWRAVK